ncbi:hypothetical protein FEM03_21095 [Phragmitibacter flavus]|uniref:Uncharacterized protein n=1 Tax=Phragmitibacter flavus TaxID=2576071 RepID=A0A5R8K8P4_9BACT|nr:hypothetical protein [Phragmitibacter flavus]TLD68683.1 hypothetical protein FEM03_21095 [Phragmitibacter flavus]
MSYRSHEISHELISLVNALQSPPSSDPAKQTQRGIQLERELGKFADKVIKIAEEAAVEKVKEIYGSR